VFSRQSFAETALKMTEVAPSFPPFLVSHGVEITHSLRKALGDNPTEASLWEELLSLRRGAGTDAFFLFPQLPGVVAEDLMLQRAVEIRALVDAVRAARHAFPGQPLDRVLRQGSLRARREVVSNQVVHVAVRLGSCFIVLPVAEEHPRVLRDRMVHLFVDSARSVGRFRPRRIVASVLVSIDPVPFGDALHLHRLGLEGPWLSWSTTSADVSLGVLSAHHLVLEGPGFASLRADFRRRSRAMSLALGLGATDEDWDPSGDFGPFDAQPFEGPLTSVGAAEALADAPGLDPEFVARITRAEAELEQARSGLGDRALFSVSAETKDGEMSAEFLRSLPAELRALVGEVRVRGGQSSGRLQSWRAPSVRYATIPRGAFSFPDFCYAYCRAQHEAMAVHQPRYPGAGFTFVVPRSPGLEAASTAGRVSSPQGGSERPGHRPTPVLCSFRTVRGVPEGAEPFKHRLRLRLAEADEGRDLLSRVLDDVLRVGLPDLFKAAAVRVFESRLHDGGTFLSGRGLVSHIEIPDEFIDPVADYGGIFEGLFAGSCQERGGISLTAVDRGYRRDLCAVGTGIFRAQAPMDLFWNRLAYFLDQAAM
jgi:hypothetical protein